MRAHDESRAPHSADRDETPAERADRNWAEIVQELRVTQTGTQILAGYLLTVAFQATFPRLAPYQHAVYLALVVLAAATTTLGLIPVSLHRQMFRRHEKSQLVAYGNRLLKGVLVLVSALTAGVVFFLFDVIVGIVPGIVAGAVMVVAMVWVLLMLPRRTARALGRASGTAGR